MAQDVKAKEQEKMTKSKQYFEESFDLINHQRFGLFSHPGCNAIGENTIAPAKLPKKDDDGRVQTEPPNFLTTKTKKGHIDQVLFSAPSYISTEDPYTDKKLVMREGKKNGHKAVCDLQFKPAKTVSKPVKSEFEHLPEDEIKKKNYRDKDGHVITQPKNFVTTGPKKGNPATTPGTLFEKEYPQHLKDEYDRKRELAIQEHKESVKKRQEKPFSQRIKPVETFSNVMDTYGEEGMTFPKKKPPQKEKPQVDHPAPFKPCNPPKKGIVDKTISKFPEYLDDKKAKEDPNFGKPPQKKVKKEDERGAWKPNTFKRSVPCPSVATNLKNIRSSLPMMMRR